MKVDYTQMGDSELREKFNTLQEIVNINDTNQYVEKIKINSLN